MVDGAGRTEALEALVGEGDWRRIGGYPSRKGRRVDSSKFRKILGRNELDGDDDSRELVEAVEGESACCSRGDRRRGG